MKIDVYISTNNDDKYLSVAADADVNQLDLPDDIDPDLLSLTPFKTSLELDPNNPIVGINQEDIIKQITKKGYAIHGSSMNVAINLAGKL
ncbi:MAG: hypothetical protein KAS57_02315 [Gammaproteobacteria bacterium]|nr:hypothetical protein [Gammaproteobacteria bacterium]